MSKHRVLKFTCGILAAGILSFVALIVGIFFHLDIAMVVMALWKKLKRES